MNDKKMRQRDRVLSYIKDFGSITSFEGFTQLGVTDTPKRISELRQDGFDIVGTSMTRPNRYGEPTHFNKYTLAKETK